MENMNLDDPSLLLGVVEIQMVLNILFNAFKSPGCIVTSSLTL
jgi:hypothetical protein